MAGRGRKCPAWPIAVSHFSKSRGNGQYIIKNLPTTNGSLFFLCFLNGMSTGENENNRLVYFQAKSLLVVPALFFTKTSQTLTDAHRESYHSCRHEKESVRKALHRNKSTPQSLVRVKKNPAGTRQMCLVPTTDADSRSLAAGIDSGEER